MATRQDISANQTETFSYDFLDRLTGVSGAYSSVYSYNEIGNILSMNSANYTYGSQPHAVTQVGAASYSYDDNGNMLTRGSDNITWDAENRPVSITTANSTTTFVYDGDGNRVKKHVLSEAEGTENQSILYINKYYEKHVLSTAEGNLTTGNVTTSYYLGGRLVATHNGTDLMFIHQDHLSGTSLMTANNGAEIDSIKYYPYGTTRAGDIPREKSSRGKDWTERACIIIMRDIMILR